jgi:hypothetical protein
VYWLYTPKSPPLTLIKCQQRINAWSDVEAKEQIDADDESRRG